MNRQCKKVTYDTKKLANLAADAIQARNGMMLWPYRCRQCRKYHLSSGGQGRLQRAFRQAKEKRHDPATV